MTKKMKRLESMIEKRRSNNEKTKSNLSERQDKQTRRKDKTDNIPLPFIQQNLYKTKLCSHIVSLLIANLIS